MQIETQNYVKQTRNITIILKNKQKTKERERISVQVCAKLFQEFKSLSETSALPVFSTSPMAPTLDLLTTGCSYCFCLKGWSHRNRHTSSPTVSYTHLHCKYRDAVGFVSTAESPLLIGFKLKQLCENHTL